MRWLLVLVIACGGAPPPARAPALTPEQEQFYRAADLVKAHKPLEALSAFDSFVMAYPDSPLKNDALLEIADLQFDQNNVAGALGMYRMTRFPDGDDRGLYVRYKIAWCELNLGQADQAVADLRTVVHAEWTGTKPRAMLIAQAKKDLATWTAQPAAPTTSSRR